MYTTKLVEFLQKHGSNEFLQTHKLKGKLDNVVKASKKEALDAAYVDLFATKGIKTQTTLSLNYNILRRHYIQHSERRKTIELPLKLLPRGRKNRGPRRARMHRQLQPPQPARRKQGNQEDLKASRSVYYNAVKKYFQSLLFFLNSNIHPTQETRRTSPRRAIQSRFDTRVKYNS